MIFGSTAIKHWHKDFREPKDLDIINVEEKRNHLERGIERYWIPEFQILLDSNEDEKYLDPNLLLTLKASHANWNIHWEKTMYDITFLKKKGYEIDREIYNVLTKGWRKVHGRKNATLIGKKKEEFFDDAIKRVYDHDSIHRAIAFYNKPIFEEILVEEGKVFCSEKEFLKLPYDKQIKMAKEEIYVTALERFIIPELKGWGKGRAYNESLKKFITTMSSGWMSFFLINNFSELIYDKFDYVSKFNENKNKLIKL